MRTTFRHSVRAHTTHARTAIARGAAQGQCRAHRPVTSASMLVASRNWPDHLEDGCVVASGGGKKGIMECETASGC